MVVNPSGEATAFCGSDLWILRRKDHSSVRVGKCEVDSMGHQISFDERGNHMSWVESANTIGIVDTDSGSVENVLIERRESESAGTMTSTALSPSGRFLAVGLPEEVRIYDLAVKSQPVMVAVYKGDRNLIGSSQILFMTSDQFLAIVDRSRERVMVLQWKPSDIRERLMNYLVHLKLRPDDISLD
jgi:hypothetical protein